MSYILSEDDRLAYTTLSKGGPQTVMELHRKTDIHRPILYKLIDGLIARGLVQESKVGKRKLYEVTTQDALEYYVAASVDNARREGKELLNSAFGVNKVVLIKNGKDITDMYDDMVNTLGEQECYYSFGTCTEIQMFSQYLSADFRKIREKKNLWSYVIATTANEYRRFSLEIKFLDDQAIKKNCLWMSYADRIVFVDFETKTGYILHDASLAKFQQGVLLRMYHMVKSTD